MLQLLRKPRTPRLQSFLNVKLKTNRATLQQTQRVFVPHRDFSPAVVFQPLRPCDAFGALTPKLCMFGVQIGPQAVNIGFRV